ncbi:YihY/virulence factor BrkB family protein [Aurantibacter aestuarii]|uniref:Ribonuclease BN n=1 Tax=Aurantibacter aestuarii TaxID=1266046 RepID=A0A2T1NBG1_9FLAO|nr:YihY/virulence factor BrkB family protein [Aurantibacter aestuarii]PSG89455.1 ribonuclease BN [Aurantibacter aestuarii]
MTFQLKSFLLKIPLVNVIVKLLNNVKPKFLEGLSLFDLLNLYVTGVAKGAIGARASAIAYSFFMALFPFLLFLIILIPHIPIEEFQTDFLVFLESFLPPTTSDFFYENIFKNLNDNNENASIISSVLILSILLMANGVNALFAGFESSYHEQLKRHFVRQYLFALGIALIIAFLLIFTVAVLGYFNIYVIGNLESYGYIQARQTSLWTTLANYVFFIIMIYIGTATLYYFGTKEGKTTKFFSLGALLTTFLIIITSFLFGIYIENFSKYNELYGSIGALLILLIYLWINSNILLLGFELNMSINLIRKRHGK